tara:strand:+ start:1466 stop:1864 length:399 start_codon:yes stop_codon:yes gene_type:complete
MVSISIENLTSAYLNVRAKRTELSSKFKKEDGELVIAQDKLKAALLEYCEEQGVESVKTSEGLVYKTSKERYWTYDWEHFHTFVLEHRAPELLDKRINQAHLREFLEENPNLLPKGLNKSVDVSVTVRKPTK